MTKETASGVVLADSARSEVANAQSSKLSPNPNPNPTIPPRMDDHARGGDATVEIPAFFLGFNRRDKIEVV